MSVPKSIYTATTAPKCASPTPGSSSCTAGDLTFILEFCDASGSGCSTTLPASTQKNYDLSQSTVTTAGQFSYPIASIIAEICNSSGGYTTYMLSSAPTVNATASPITYSYNRSGTVTVTSANKAGSTFSVQLNKVLLLNVSNSAQSILVSGNISNADIVGDPLACTN